MGKKEVVVSHLQYADDSIFFGEAKKENLVVLKSVLRSFELLSGLKINYKKICLMGVGVEGFVLENWANALNCSVGEIPFVYLGLPIGAKSGDRKIWRKAIERIENRLAAWENHFLSFADRLVLLKVVLISLSIHYLSFFKAPSFVLTRLKQIQIHFLWGGSLGGKKKITWVKWEVICKLKEQGGLGVKILEWFNLALLGKWVWRLLGESNSFWVRILSSKYGNILEFIESCKDKKVRVKGWSSWWRDIVKYVAGSDWFRVSVCRKVGDENSTRFWEDVWVKEGVKLSVLFPRLYSLELSKECVVSDRVGSSNGNLSVVWQWRRGMFVWED